MFKTKILLSLSLAIFGCSAEVENPLIGKWKSNKEETLNLARVSMNLNSETVKRLKNDAGFGDLVLEFTETKITTIYQGSTTKEKYKVIENNGGNVKINIFSNESKRSILSVFVVKGNRMSVISSLTPKITEVFDKVE